jgi:hypothetical protein
MALERSQELPGDGIAHPVGWDALSTDEVQEAR